jgi:hypothetical protein
MLGLAGRLKPQVKSCSRASYAHTITLVLTLVVSWNSDEKQELSTMADIR